MRVDRLMIRNFRNLADIDIPLLPGTVIVGENRAGKSNLLYALRLVLDPRLPNSDRVLAREDFWDGLSDGSTTWDPMAAGEEIIVSVEMTDFEDDDNVVAVLSDCIDPASSPMRAKITYRFGPDDSDPPSAATYSWGICGGLLADQPMPGDLRKYLGLAYLGALRDVESDLLNWRKSPLRPLLIATAEQVKEEELERIGKAVQTANEQVSALEPVRDLGNRISSRTAEMVGGSQALETELSIASQDPLRLLRTLRMYVDGEARRPLASASLGSLNVLYLALLELLLDQRAASLDEAHTVLEIEEPEAHLHPHLQRLIFKRLLHSDVANRTVLLTTHSPHIVSVAQPRSLVVLRPDGTKTRAYVASHAQLDEADWLDIERYFDATRAELAFAKRVLLVEGYAEQVIIPAIARSLGLNLDKVGVTVCAIHGTHFTPYVKLCEALGIPWSVITDGDPGEKGKKAGDDRKQAIIDCLPTDRKSDASAQIAVGDSTLEYDVYRASLDNVESYKRVLGELCGPQVSKRVAEWDNPSCDDVLAAIKNGGGKGRFAQRLAQEKIAAPDYVAAVLQLLAP
ncbi:AAA family ATPase [Micromonospora sp. NPDC005324]|uniref:ATP-dependent nuclease n=1 Tax=Micromonospora sp. NPDC005324 TaxID=3157033 RepID=UPI0033BD0640